MITINRTLLLNELFDFSQTGSGLIVGKPGVGKSYILKELKDYYLEQNILSFMIKIDNLVDSSDRAIQDELGFDSNWIETFKKIKLSEEHKALLIFDAFDAARNEDFRNKILDQIKRAKEELSNKWNILVSVRTYDATKSQKLIQLFPLSEDYSDYINCRKKYIPALENEEVIEAVSLDKALLQFYTDSTQALKDILRIPFFLILSEKILQGASDKEINEIKKLKSETQLLKTYWNRKITGASNNIGKEKILFALTKVLVESKSLSCAKKTFFQYFDTGDSESFEYLRSENIIDEVSINGSRVAFSHNILFDYAVSTLYITTDVEEVLKFIKEDASRPFFLRPSFVYFYTQLWYENKDLFWKFFWKYSGEKSREIQLFVRLVLTGVISSEYDNLADLNPITGHLDATTRKSIIRNFLQSIRFIRKKTIPQDIELLEHLSNELDTIFLWDFGFLLDRAINEPVRIEHLLENCGKAARNFLTYILGQRQTQLKLVVERLGATRGVELVCKTYGTDIEASKTILRSLFELLKEPDFEIYYFTNLAEYVKDVLNFDPAFVTEIYSTIFGHSETSNAQTSMGSTIIANFTSNRRQDFEMCYFRLTEFYPTFLSHTPPYAIPIGLKIVNDYVVKDKEQFGETVLSYGFKFKNRDCFFIPDFSSIRADNLQYHKPASIANLIINHFQKLIEASQIEELIKYLDLYIESSKVGYTWKTLISFGSKVISALPDYFFDFCIEEVFLTNSDTSFETGELIEIGSNYFNDSQIKAIEERIFEIASKSEKRKADYFLRKYLSRVPVGRLQLENSKKIIKESGTLENIKPFESGSYSRPYTTEQWLQDKGVDTSDTKTAELLNKSSELSTFNHTWLNGSPPKEEYETVFEKGADLFYKLSDSLSKVNSNVIFSVLSDIAQTFAIISRDISSLSEGEFKVIKEIILFCYGYSSEFDKESDENVSPSRGYSPTPRIVASEGLPHIVSREDTKENIDLLTSAVNDTNSIVRFHAIRQISIIEKKQPDYFWNIIYSRLEKEDDAFVASAILQNIPYSPYDENVANKVLNIAYKKEQFFKWNNSFLDNFTIRAIWLYTTHKNVLADKILGEAYTREEFCRTVIFKAFEDFKILSLNVRPNSEFFIESTQKWTLHYLHKVGEDLNQVKTEEFKNDNPLVKGSLNLIDLIIQRIYFVFERRARGNRPFFEIPEENRRSLYFKIKPVFEKILLVSTEIQGGGLIVAHTAHYFIETLNSVLLYDAKAILSMVTNITKLSFQTGYTFDSMAIREVVNLTEKLLADYRELLTEENSFSNLIDLLDIYINSGWVDALELLWKLDEIFK